VTKIEPPSPKKKKCVQFVSSLT